MILVTGAAGKTGLAVLDALEKQGVAARALVHRAAQEEAVRASGADDVVLGDLRDADAMAKAVDGAQAIYHICPNVSPHEVAIGMNVLQAARRAGVERFVYHSVLHPQAESMPHHWRKLRVEELLFESGLPFTVLQPAAYMQNVVAYWPTIAAWGVYQVPYDVAARVTMVDLTEVAEVAARVLTEDGHRGATYELCGPESLDQREVAAVLGEVLEVPVEAVSSGIETWQEEARAEGLDDGRIEILSAMFRYYERYGLVGNPNVLEWLLGRSPATFRDFVERFAEAS